MVNMNVLKVCHCPYFPCVHVIAFAIDLFVVMYVSAFRTCVYVVTAGVLVLPVVVMCLWIACCSLLFFHVGRCRFASVV